MIRKWAAVLFSALTLLAMTGACTDSRVVRRVNPSPAMTINLDYVFWCQDEHGASLFYPCKWDSRVRPVVSWASGQPKVAIWVRRAVGCPVPLPENTTCFWAPADQ